MALGGYNNNPLNYSGGGGFNTSGYGGGGGGGGGYNNSNRGYPGYNNNQGFTQQSNYGQGPSGPGMITNPMPPLRGVQKDANLRMITTAAQNRKIMKKFFIFIRIL